MKRLIAVLAVAALFPVAVANADTIAFLGTGPYGTFNNFTASYYSDPNGTGLIRQYGYYAGEFRLSGLNGSTDPFIAYCANFFDYLYSPQTMTQRPIGDYPSPPGVNPPYAQAGSGLKIGWLMDQYQGGVDSSIEGAAMQLAIWELAYEKADPTTGLYSYGLGAGNFRVTGDAGLILLANTYLTGVGSLNSGLWLDSGSWSVAGAYQQSGQDYVVPVPEPGSMVLLGSGLIGLAAAIRRRMRK